MQPVNDPYEDFHLDDIPPPPPVHYAEQALLGALLLDPHRLKTIGPLGPEHFASAVHSAAFAAMAALTPPAPAVHAKEPVWLASVLEHARPQARGLDSPYLHTLVGACPQPEHAPAYARMIRADHARRTVRVHAHLLGEAATDSTLPNPAATVAGRADTLARVLDDLAGQFAAHPGSLPRTPLPPPPGTDTDVEVGEEELLLLSTATAHPDVLKAMRWLHPGDFAIPLHGQLFQCLTTLVQRGEPVDEVTVLWEAQHRGLLAETTAPADLLALLSTPAGSPEHWGERILQRSLLAAAHNTATRITAYSEDRANTVHQLITGSRRTLADLTAVRTRWQHATTPTPTGSARPRTPAASRAGPPIPRAAAPAVSTRASR